jgi:hypothetical protein
MKAVVDDGRLFLEFRQGADVVRVRIPGQSYRKIWAADGAYDLGDSVTYNGSQWICCEAGTSAKPGDGSGAWHLAVKEGRRGKDGTPGPEGKPGRDLTQMDETGRKW